jgi:hypothetical protein
MLAIRKRHTIREDFDLAIRELKYIHVPVN